LIQNCPSCGSIRLTRKCPSCGSILEEQSGTLFFTDSFSQHDRQKIRETHFLHYFCEVCRKNDLPFDFLFFKGKQFIYDKGRWNLLAPERECVQFT
jgi:rRNA maturation protein Nop10